MLVVLVTSTGMVGCDDGSPAEPTALTAGRFTGTVVGVGASTGTASVPPAGLYHSGTLVSDSSSEHQFVIRIYIPNDGPGTYQVIEGGILGEDASVLIHGPAIDLQFVAVSGNVILTSVTSTEVAGSFDVTGSDRSFEPMEGDLTARGAFRASIVD